MDSLRVAYQSEQGRRETNEDMIGLPHRLARRSAGDRSLAIRPASGTVGAYKGALFLLADGVGGYEGGEIASRLAVEEVAARYYQDPSSDTVTSLQRVFEAANRQIWRYGQQAAVPTRLATTLVAGVFQQRTLTVAGVGDSRAYLIRDCQATALTADHSWVQRQLNHGQLTTVEAASSPYKNRIERCLGSSEQIGVDTWQVELMPGDKVLLCSDGVSNYLDEQMLGQLACRSGLQQAVNALIDTAYDNGSTDNMSVILVAIGGSK